MIDYMASTIARLEHEERVRKLTPVYNDEWLKVEAGNWQAWQVGDLFSSLVSGLASLADRLKRKADEMPDKPALQHSPLSGTSSTTVVKSGQG